MTVTPKEIYNGMTPRDRQQVESICFRAGRFTNVGEVACDGHNDGFLICVSETPDLRKGGTAQRLARSYRVEPWVVRFRALIGD